jgi:hypothetical protein
MIKFLFLEAIELSVVTHHQLLHRMPNLNLIRFACLIFTLSCVLNGIFQENHISFFGSDLKSRYNTKIITSTHAIFKAK